MFPKFEKSSRPIAEQDAVLRVGLQSLAVQADGGLKVPTLARLIALLHLIHELRLAEATAGHAVRSQTPCGPACSPRTEDGKLQKRTESRAAVG